MMERVKTWQIKVMKIIKKLIVTISKNKIIIQTS